VKRRPDRYRWLDQIRDGVRDGTLSSNAGHVALTLAVYYVNGTGEAWPSQLELASATGRSESTVRRGLHELERNALLEVRHGRPARSFGNVYRLLTRSQ
jgi:hypothetical protein